jgi:hypothetical protein
MSDDIGRPACGEALADRLAILDVLAIHSRGLDRLDSRLIKLAYWPEAIVDYGGFKGAAHQFAELVTGALAESYELTQHCLSNSLVALSEDSARGALPEGRARVESLVSAYHLLAGGQEAMSFCGRYLDKLERRDGLWKLIHRRVVMDWSQRQAVVDERGAESFMHLTKGRNDSDDASYALFSGEEQTDVE